MSTKGLFYSMRTRRGIIDEGRGCCLRVEGRENERERREAERSRGDGHMARCKGKGERAKCVLETLGDFLYCSFLIFFMPYHIS